MEWNERSANSSQSSSPSQGGVAHTVKHHVTKTFSSLTDRLMHVVVLFGLALLLFLVVTSLVLGGRGNLFPESRFVDKDRKQAVFLNGGQVYFGKITELNSKYVRLSNIYYLRVNQQVQPNQGNNNENNNNISLVKLGCELHGPTDEMIINREQVVFWENLRDNGDVVTAVTKHEKENPDNKTGQKCEKPAANPSSSNNSQSNNP